MSDTGNIGRDLNARREAHTGDLSQRRVRLLRRRGVHAGAHATTLRRALEGRRLVLADLVSAALADQLLDCRHRLVSLSVWWVRNSLASHSAIAASGSPLPSLQIGSAVRTPHGQTFSQQLERS
ncbi:hypothetical protein HMPREF1034_1506 [Cutibacterium acnes SK187]|nr:hypothetical protein HMPREF1034_1506 [Cutibacterium acnes SK187]